MPFWSYLAETQPWPAAAEWAPQAAGAIAGILSGWLVGRPINFILAFFFRGFNACFKALTGVYTWSIGWLLRLAIVVLVVYGGCLWLTYDKFATTPRGFIPSQDMGFLMASVQLPDSASIERTEKVMKTLQRLTLDHPAVMHATYISGQSFVLNAAASNFGSMFVGLKDTLRRPEHGQRGRGPIHRDRIEAVPQLRSAFAALSGAGWRAASHS